MCMRIRDLFEKKFHEKEDDQVRQVKSQLKKIMGPAKQIPLRIGGRTVMVSQAKKAKGDYYKNDLVFLDDQGNEVAWASLKSGKDMGDFRQWGGLSKFEDHPEVQSFIQACSAYIKKHGKLPYRERLTRAIQDPDLTCAIVYGFDYGKDPGHDNVDVVIQGDIELILEDGVVEIKAHKIWKNGEIPQEKYAPTMTAIRAEDRSSFGVNKTRIVVYPRYTRKYPDEIPL